MKRPVVEIEHLDYGKYSIQIGSTVIHVDKKTLEALYKDIEAFLYDEWMEEYYGDE